MAHASLSGQTIAFETIEGPPAAVRSDLTSELAAAAASRRVDVTGLSGAARYRIKGYLSTDTGADGVTSLTFVWDLFDGQMRRANRVAGSNPIRMVASDPWLGLDREALRKIAEQSMEEIAVFLAAHGEPAPPG